VSKNRKDKLTPKQERKYYVYHLIDPRDNFIFYVGKGSGNRIKQHISDAKAGKVQNAEKHRRIEDIHKAGLNVVELIVADNLTEDHAFIIERGMIQDMKHNGITNIANGFMTNAEKCPEQAKALIKMTKPFDVWVKTIGDYRRKAVIAVSGSLEAFYKDRMDFLNMVVGMGKCQQEN